MSETPITAHELARELLALPDVPIKIRLNEPEDPDADRECVILHTENHSFLMHSASSTIFGDIPSTVIFDIYMDDSA